MKFTYLKTDRINHFYYTALVAFQMCLIVYCGHKLKIIEKNGEIQPLKVVGSILQHQRKILQNETKHSSSLIRMGNELENKIS